jgi:uncharacterized protein DUF4339
MTDGGDNAVRWFYVQEGRRKGPVGAARLVELMLDGELPEDALVWHSGLPEWVEARAVEQIKRELPPPVPSKRSHGSDLSDVEELGEEADDDEAPADEGPTDEEPPLEPGARDAEVVKRARRRRRHRTRYRLIHSRPHWLVPLIVMVIVVVVVVWYMLRRVNEVPPGRIVPESAVVAVDPPRA